MSKAATTSEYDGINFEEIVKWSPEQVTRYLDKEKVPIGDRFLIHRISGDLLPVLTDKDYEKMEFTAIGDCLRVKKAVQGIQKKARVAERNKVIWEGEEFITLCCNPYNLCYYPYCRCCEDPVPQYKLYEGTLSIKKVKPKEICGCVLRGRCISLLLGLCSPSSFSVDNVSLITVDNVDFEGVTPSFVEHSCCCIVGRDIVSVTSNPEGSGNDLVYQLGLRSGQGSEVCTIIRNVVDANKEKMRK